MKVEEPQCRHRCTNCNTSLRSEDRASGAGCGYLLFTAAMVAILILGVVRLADRVEALERSATAAISAKAAR